MKQDRALLANPDVVSREVGGETILLDLESGTYFGLNAVGGRVWQMLESGRKSLVELCDSVETEFDAPRGEIERDVAALVDHLLEQGLVTSEG